MRLQWRSERFRVQLHQHPSYTSHQSSDGGWRHRSAVERLRPGEAVGSLRTAEGAKHGMTVLYEIVGYLLPAGVALWRLVLVGAARQTGSANQSSTTKIQSSPLPFYLRP
jgi:hypothetical protein